MERSSILQKYFNEASMMLAWQRVVRWSDRTTKDHFGIKMFGYNLEKNLVELSELVISGSYKPSRPQKFYVPKSSKMQRTKSILTIEDAIVYQAIVNTIATENYNLFAENNDFVFGSVLADEVRLGTEILNGEVENNLFFFKHYLNLYKKFADSVNKAILTDKVTHKFETDITGFFDSIPHFSLLTVLSEKFNVEGEILDLLSECLNCWSGTRDRYTFGVGIPQGPQPSFFLANALLNDLDNMIKGDGHIYYRYMDDIRIYAFDDTELTSVLVNIDAYLKGFALSLNAKKTSIEKVRNDDTDDSIISFGLNYEVTSLPANSDIEANSDFSVFAEQEGDGFKLSDIKTITDPEAIVEFWQKMYNDSLEDIKKLFHLVEGNLKLKDERIEDRAILASIYQYRQAVRGLKNFTPDFGPDKNLIPYLFILLHKFPWRADQYCWVFQEFKDVDTLKTELIKNAELFQSYEWIRHHLYLTIAVSQSINKREWQDLFRRLKLEKDFYAKLSLYKLLLYHGLDKQQLAQVTMEVSKETNLYVKKELLFYAQTKHANQFSFKELMTSFGL